MQSHQGGGVGWQSLRWFRAAVGRIRPAGRAWNRGVTVSAIAGCGCVASGGRGAATRLRPPAPRSGAKRSGRGEGGKPPQARRAVEGTAAAAGNRCTTLQPAAAERSEAERPCHRTSEASAMRRSRDTSCHERSEDLVWRARYSERLAVQARCRPRGRPVVAQGSYDGKCDRPVASATRRESQRPLFLCRRRPLNHFRPLCLARDRAVGRWSCFRLADGRSRCLCCRHLGEQRIV